MYLRVCSMFSCDQRFPYMFINLSLPPAPQTTLLHLASHHNLMSLARHLVTLPGVHLALYLPDEQGFTPMDVARNVGNMDIMKLFTATL